MDTFEIRNNKAVYNGVGYDFDKLPEDVVFDGNIDVSCKSLKKLPNMSTWIIKGCFTCSYNYLISLEGCPKEVMGDFDFHFNKLTSLEYCPTMVGGDFDCSSNKLISLDGCPKEVGGSFTCIWNGILSLKGCPKEVGGKFNCSHNCVKLIDSWPEHIEHYYVYFNNPIECIKDGVLPLKYLIEFYKDNRYNAKELLMKEFGCNTVEELKAYLIMMGKI